MPSITRRRLLTGLASSVAVAPFVSRGWAQSGRLFAADPFSLGVASGDPDDHSVVLWTRLAPSPLQPDSGMPSVTVPVDWEIAEDDKMQRVIRRGTADARPEDGHSLHVIADGLAPDCPYWYRFIADGITSRIGRTRTLPARGALPARFRLAVAGCQRIEHGFFTAWADLSETDVDLVFHYGDYMYEYALTAEAMAARMDVPVPDAARVKPTSLAEYRTRYALYKLDPDLTAAHAAHPFIASFDDHEVVNNWGGMSHPAKMRDRDFLKLRAAAFQAFYENQPVRPGVRPRGADITMYRSFDMGRLLRLAVLDTRQFRSLPPCGKAETRHCDERLAPGRNMIGATQERWLFGLFDRRDTAWTVLGNQVLMMQLRRKEAAQDIVNTDKWDGNAAARTRLLQGAVDRKVGGLVAVTGDIHRAIAGNLMVDFGKPGAAPVGVEFVASSISSDGDGGRARKAATRLMANNPHLRFYDGRRGSLICEFDERRCQATYRAVDVVSTRGGKVSTASTFTVEAKQPGLG
jgi:alkaline phosphatase D